VSRPVGVTASAIVAILGSMIALLFAAFMAASPFIAPAQPQPPNSAQIAVVGAAITAALAGLGIWTPSAFFGSAPGLAHPS